MTGEMPPFMKTLALQILSVLTISFLVGGCDVLGSSQNLACTREWRPGIRVEVTSASGDTLSGTALVSAHSGDYADLEEVNLDQDHVAALSHERPGEYTVTVEKSGYETWRKSEIDVEKGRCHVKTVELNVKLAPR